MSENVDRIRRKYGRYLSQRDWEIVNSLDEGDKAYFWTMLDYEVGEGICKEMEKEILYGHGRARPTIPLTRAKKEDFISPKPFTEAENSLRPSSWFKTVR